MERTDTTDADLVSQTLAGNREAFGCLFDRHARMVRAVVGKVSLDWPTIEDMTQESFLRAYRTLHRLREPRCFGAWIVGIARRVARERKRSLLRDRHEFSNESLVNTTSSASSEDDVEDAEQFEYLMSQLTRLSDKEQLAIHTFFLQSHNVRQAAKQLKLSRSGFHALLRKAILNLTKLVESQGNKGEVEK